MNKHGHIILADEQPAPDINACAEDIKGIAVESLFTSRWALVEGYWSIGQRIRADISVDHKEGNAAHLSALTKLSGIGERTLYRCVQVFDKYPDISTLPEGKNISWNKLINKYLPQSKEVKELPDTFSKEFDAEKVLLPLIMAVDTRELTYETSEGILTVKLTPLKPTKTEFGNGQINELVGYWQEVIGATIISGTDRMRIKNLLQNKAIKEYFEIEDDIERIKHYFDEIAKYQSFEFWPGMASPADAFRKFNNYTLFINRLENKRK